MDVLLSESSPFPIGLQYILQVVRWALSRNARKDRCVADECTVEQLQTNTPAVQRQPSRVVGHQILGNSIQRLKSVEIGASLASEGLVRMV